MANIVQVARKNFVDGFSNLAVEKCLLEPMKSMFCARTVESQSDETIRTLAAEDETSHKERKRLEARVSALQRCLDHLRRLDRHNFRGRSSQSVIVTALADDAQCIPRQRHSGTVFQMTVLTLGCQLLMAKPLPCQTFPTALKLCPSPETAANYHLIIRR